MAYEPPQWANDLEILSLAMAKRGPEPLLTRLSKFADIVVTDEEFDTYLQHTSKNDPALIALRRALITWDKQPDTAFTDLAVRATPRNSQVRRQAIYAALALKEPARTVLDTRAQVYEKSFTMISQRHEPWYPQALQTRESVYWNDYETYLREIKRWPDEAIDALDQSTYEIMERLSDPTRSALKKTKGLVVGHVQSGKTASFTGLAAKAIDAGYRLVIVLTGTIEILRAQTQRRLDMELIGIENILAGQDPDDPLVRKELHYLSHDDWPTKFVTHGSALEHDGVVHIVRATVHDSDYQRLRQGLTKLRFHRHDSLKPLNHPDNLFRSDAYVAVVKKQKDSLAKLIADLTPLRDDLDHLPVLIIDDESDQASIDTTSPAKRRAGKRTKINKLITDLLRICGRAQYVGYTATPFANVFIDLNDPQDLFPSNFVLSLDAPKNYMGLKDFHDIDKDWDVQEKTVATSNELAYVRTLKGDPHTAPAQRDTELRQALDAWVLAGAVKLFRRARTKADAQADDDFRHHTMLVHESAGTDDHAATAATVRRLWATGQFNAAAGLRRLESLYGNDLLPVMNARANGNAVPESFATLKPFIALALAQISIDNDPILIVNSDKEIQAQKKKLDFDADPVWRILIGGAKLSRGFTIEGLTVSYFRRKAGQGDTLMQAGRWFGFRPGYQDLVRLYIRRDKIADLYAEFEALLGDEEAFRAEIRKYEGLDDDGMPLLEPIRLPPLVQQTLPWLRPTSRNKMWNAVIESKGTTGVEDRYGLPDPGAPENKSNLLDVGLPLLVAAPDDAILPYAIDRQSPGTVPAKVGIITAAAFLQLFDQFHWYPEYYEEVIRPFRNFLGTATSDATITDWAIIWPQPTKNAVPLALPGLCNPAPIITRTRRPKRHDFNGSDAKHRSAAEPIARGQVGIAGHPASHSRGVVVVYLVDDRLIYDGHRVGELSTGCVVPLLSMAAPMSLPARGPQKIRGPIFWTVRVKSKEDHAVVDISDLIGDRSNARKKPTA